MALEQSAWELMAIGMGLLKDREVLIDSARLLSIVVMSKQGISRFMLRFMLFCLTRRNSLSNLEINNQGLMGV